MSNHIWRYECPKCDCLIKIQPTSINEGPRIYTTVCPRCIEIKDFKRTNGLTIKYKDKIIYD